MAIIAARPRYAYFIRWRYVRVTSAAQVETSEDRNKGQYDYNETYDGVANPISIIAVLEHHGHSPVFVHLDGGIMHHGDETMDALMDGLHFRPSGACIGAILFESAMPVNSPLGI